MHRTTTWTIYIHICWIIYQATGSKLPASKGPVHNSWHFLVLNSTTAKLLSNLTLAMSLSISLILSKPLSVRSEICSTTNTKFARVLVSLVAQGECWVKWDRINGFIFDQYHLILPMSPCWEDSRALLTRVELLCSLADANSAAHLHSSTSGSLLLTKLLLSYVATN